MRRTRGCGGSRPRPTGPRGCAGRCHRHLGPGSGRSGPGSGRYGARLAVPRTVAQRAPATIEDLRRDLDRHRGGIGSPRGGCSGARGPGPGWGGRRPGPAKARATRGRGRSSGGGRPSRRVRSSSAYRGLDGRERRVPAVAPLAGPVRLRVRPVDSAIRGGRASGSRRPSRPSVWRPRVRAETEEDHD